jgi:tripartite-type tricarboxylate transporter receptor subunit TctC
MRIARALSRIALPAVVAAMSVHAHAQVSSGERLATQSWPSRPVRIVVPDTPGGGIDVVAGVMAQ